MYPVFQNEWLTCYLEIYLGMYVRAYPYFLSRDSVKPELNLQSTYIQGTLFLPNYIGVL